MSFTATAYARQIRFAQETPLRILFRLAEKSGTRTSILALRRTYFISFAAFAKRRAPPSSKSSLVAGVITLQERPNSFIANRASS
jgi:hypothetical protein